MTITILGANGKLGAMIANGARQAGLVWQTQARAGEASIIWSGDFEEPAAKHVLKSDSVLINMIGKTGGDPADMQAANVDFVRSLLHHAAMKGIAHVVLASSAAVYGMGDGRAFKETDQTKPTTPYGLSKVAMERLAEKAKVPVTILRIGNVAGADALLAAARRFVDLHKPMDLHRLRNGDAPRRSYIGPDDLFHAIHRLTKPHDGPPRIVNVAHPQSVSLDSMLRAYKAQVLPELEWQDTPLPDGVPGCVTLNTDTLQHLVEMSEYSDPADAFVAQMNNTPIL